MKKEVINEDFTKLYIRWNSGKKRKEDGTEVNTDYGKIILKNASCDYEKLIKMFLDEDDGDICAFFYMIQNMGFSTEERHNIIEGLAQYDFPLEDIKHGGLCVGFLDYNEAIEGHIDEYEYCEEDYKSICKCFANYLKDNVEISHVKGKPGDYQLILYSGDVPEDFDIDIFRDEFESYYETSIETWSFSGETNIGVEINYENVNNFKDMKNEVEGWM